MANVADPPPTSDPAFPAAAKPLRRRGPRLTGARLVIGLYVLAVAGYVLLGLTMKVPYLFADEHRYSQLARSLVDGHGFVWRGEGHANPAPQTAALYVYFLAPAWWLLDSAVHAREVSKVLGALALCAQVFPVWLLARRLVGDRLAVVPALLSIAGTWMVVSALTLTEVLAFPLATAMLCCTVAALRAPGSRIWCAALLFALLAASARLQLIALLPVLPLAVVLDVLRCPDRRARLRAHAPLLITSATLTIAAIAASRAVPSTFGDYRGLAVASPPSLDGILRKTGLELLELLAAAGFLPVLAAAAALLSRQAWRDDRTGPLLVVFWLGALATCVQTGLYLAWDTTIVGGVERYVVYALPVAFVLLVTVIDQRGRLPRGTLVLGALASALLLVMPQHQAAFFEAATWATAQSVRGMTGLGRPEALALGSALTVLAAWALSRLPSKAAGAAATIALVLAVLAVQDRQSWDQLISATKAFRSVYPEDLEWVQRARGPVAVFNGMNNAPALEGLDYFSTKILRSYRTAEVVPSGPVIQGQTCAYVVGASGLVSFGTGCGAPPHRLLLQDRKIRWTFYGETSSLSEPRVGRIVETDPAQPPRLRSQLTLPCDTALPAISTVDDARIEPASARSRCATTMPMNFWLDAPGAVAITFRGGPRDQTASVGATRYGVPARRMTTIEGELPAGDSQVTMNLGWDSSDGPSLVKATLRTGGRTISLLY